MRKWLCECVIWVVGVVAVNGDGGEVIDLCLSRSGTWAAHYALLEIQQAAAVGGGPAVEPVYVIRLKVSICAQQSDISR